MKAFFKDVFRRMAVLFVSAFLFAILSLVIFSFFADSLISPKEERIEDDSFLVLDLTMNLTDRPADVSFEDLTRQALADEKMIPEYHLKELIDALESASQEKYLRGIFITGGFVPSGYGCGYETILELVRALEAFKQSGKKIIGYLHSPRQLDYLVYSVCDELIMDPAGTMLITGLASEQLFLGDSFKKYGVGIQVVRTGRYKGAVETFTDNEFSDENRAQIQNLLNRRWKHYLQTVSTLRSMRLGDLNQTLAEKFIWKPKEAFEQGFVDRVDDFGGVIDRLIELGAEEEEENTFAQIGLGDYLERLRPNSLAEVEDGERKIALVYVEGAITDGWGDNGESVGGDEIARRIRKIRKTPESYKAIVLRINSPGGSVSGAESILFELIRAREAGMPVIVSMGPVAASGGYWIATASDKIFAGTQSITGSIGVFGILPNVESLGSTYGLKWDRVKTSPSADIFSVARPKTTYEIGVFQDYVNETYDRFLNLVGKSRGLDVGEVEKMAEGRVWTGLEAYELGLVDQIGGLSKALEEAVKVAGLESGYEIEEFPKIRTPAAAIAEFFDIRTDGVSLRRETSFNSPVLEKISDIVPLLKSFNDPIGIYGILPWYRAQLGFNHWEMKL
mgnify:CR=1 FL=1